MKFYWSYKSLPEFANVPPEDRKRLWKLCLAKANRHPIIWSIWGGYFVLGAIQSFFMPAVRRAIPIERVVDNPFVAGLLLGLVIHAPWLLALWQVYMWLARKHIATELPGHCSRCGYDLTGIDSRKCPECGAAL